MKFTEVFKEHKKKVIFIIYISFFTLMYAFYYMGYNDGIIIDYDNISNYYESNYNCFEKVKEVILYV